MNDNRISNNYVGTMTIRQEIQKLKDDFAAKFAELENKYANDCPPPPSNSFAKAKPTEFEAGKWYCSSDFGIYGLFQQPGSGNKGFIDGRWGTIAMSVISGWQLADTEKVKELLIAEAKKRGFTPRSKIKTLWKYPIVYLPLYSVNWSYNFIDDTLSYGTIVYKNGEWAEIVKDDSITILEYNVEINRHDRVISIYDKTYSFDQIMILHSIMLAGQVKSLNVGCEGQEKIGIDVIERILSKINS